MQPKTEDRTCPVCGVVYQAQTVRLKHGRETTCSRACSYALRGDKRDRRVGLQCAVCGEEFSRPPSQIKAKHGANYCSFPCHQLGRGLGLTRRIVGNPYRYTEGGITRLRVAGAHTYAAGKTLAFPQYEIDVREMFARIGLHAIHQHVFEHERGGFAVDFFLPDLGLVLELDGPEHRRRGEQGRDADRDAIVAAAGLRTIRVPVDPDRPEEVCKAVVRALAE